MQINLPKKRDRLVNVGRTGTGKTVAGLWHLSNYPLDDPWVLFNFKDDEHIESIDKAVPIDYDFIPRQKDEGLYVINVMPADTKGSFREPSILEKYFEKLWQRQNIGIFIDEAFMVGQNDAFEMCLTQGRSRRLPMIINTQRPCWISRFCFSEASYIQVFDLNDDRDIQTIESFVPVDWDTEKPLAKHHSYYYDIAEDSLVRFAPVPDMDAIRKVFDAKLKRKRVRL